MSTIHSPKSLSGPAKQDHVDTRLKIDFILAAHPSKSAHVGAHQRLPARCHVAAHTTKHCTQAPAPPKATLVLAHHAPTPQPDENLPSTIFLLAAAQC
jgi:hypothetical protein